MVARATLKRGSPCLGAARKAAAWCLLVLGVAAVHGCVVSRVGGMLSALRSHTDDDMPQRMDVRYVREMAIAPAAAVPARAAAPRPAVPPVPVAPRAKSAKPAAEAPAPPVPAEAAASEPTPPASAADAASSPQTAESSEEADDSQEAVTINGASDAMPPAVAALLAANAASSQPTPAPDPAASAVDSVWPQSTRVRYTGSGYYRGEISGSASVEWVRQGNRYQMHMDVRMGLFQRRATSQGRIETQGVVPERYDESNKVLFGSERRATLRMGAQEVELAEGQRLPRPPNLQDTTSQFVQITYLFATRPGLLAAGRKIEFPLAFPRRIRAYSYQVNEMETLHTAFGPLQALHVKPQRAEAKERDLIAEAWFAPQLHYLPVRIRISQGEDTYIDLLIDKRPELAQ